ncbi:MAG: hypothetical protein HY318_18890 [Armatimonadetes bacterium]|nr:hypothetical protein [Armatimonadota bacterium]
MKVTIEIDFAKLGLAANAPWKDMLADRPMTAVEAVEIPPGNCRLVQVGESTNRR